MKKTKAMLIIICQFILVMTNAQQSKQLNIKKQQFCSAEITRMDRSVEKFALGGFTGDSIILYQLSRENGHRQILLDRESRIAASEVKRVRIHVETVRKSPDIFTKTNSFEEQTNRSYASNLQGTHAMDGVGKTLGFFAADPVTLAAGIVLLPIIVPVAILTAKEKTYHINGNARRLKRIEKRIMK